LPGPKVHFRFTMEWAIEEGMPEADAETVARANVQVDQLWPGRRQWGRHFNPMATYVLARRYAAQAATLESAGAHEEALVALGRALHSLQDGIGHGRLGLAHLKHRVGLLKHHPDDWDPTPLHTQDGIERVTRAALREFLDASTRTH